MRNWIARRQVLVYVVGVAKVLVCWYRPDSGIVPVEIRDGHYGPVVLSWDARLRTKMKRKSIGHTASSKDGPAHLAPIDSQVLSRWVVLLQHLAVIRYDDGEPRQPGKVFVETMGSAWKVVITDPDSCGKLQVVGQTPEEALDLACLLLDADDTPWEADPYAMSRKKRK